MFQKCSKNVPKLFMLACALPDVCMVGGGDGGGADGVDGCIVVVGGGVVAVGDVCI